MAAVDIEKLVRPGEVLAGKYRIERVLGQGGMGVVVAAHHLQLDARVALKFLLPDAVNRADLVTRFEREARAAVKIKSEHVARVIDVGVLDTGSPYMVMEYLEGVDLAQRLEQTGPISVQETSDFVLQACEAIVEAHALGIIHRDLKPANLFCIRGADGLQSIKVLDFGISKTGSLGGSGAGMTQTQSMLGSPFYMSPEQMQSAKNVDMRTDIWALGVILYQCVTGIVPFEAETLPELVLKIVTQPLAPLKSVRPDIPSAFDQIVSRCLEKDRDRRFQHIGELASVLVGFAPDRGRASADRIMRVVATSGIGSGQVRPPHPSSHNLPAAEQRISQGVIPSQPIPSQPFSASAANSATAFQDSQARHRPSQTNLLPPQSITPQPRLSGPPSYRQTTPLGPPPGTLPPGQMPHGFGVTSGSFGNTNRPEANHGAKWIIVGTVVSFLLAAMVVVAFIGKSYLQRPQAQKLVPSGTSSVPATPPPTVVTTLPPPTAIEPEVVDAGTTATLTFDAGHVTTTPTVTTALPDSRKLTPAKVDCTTPYVYKGGIKVFKPECL